MKPPCDFRKLDPMIRDVVVWLREHGFAVWTATYSDGVAAIIMRAHPMLLLKEADRLHALLQTAGVDEDRYGIDASYSPKSTEALILLKRMTSELL